MNNKPTTFEHIKSIIVLPIMVTIVIPMLILWFANYIDIVGIDIGIAHLPGSISIILGLTSFVLGMILFVASLRLFIKIGNGTLAPWNPTKKLVIYGLFKFVRNPMLIGVNFILLSEALFFKSEAILFWMIFFIMINTIYFKYKEEPDLLKKFGEEYNEYCKHVPRWIPRLTPYQPK